MSQQRVRLEADPVRPAREPERPRHRALGVRPPALEREQLGSQRQARRLDAHVSTRPLVLYLLQDARRLLVPPLRIERLGERDRGLSERAVYPHLDEHVVARAQRSLGGGRVSGGQLQAAEVPIRPLRHVGEAEFLADRRRALERAAARLEAASSSLARSEHVQHVGLHRAQPAHACQLEPLAGELDRSLEPRRTVEQAHSDRERDRVQASR